VPTPPLYIQEKIHPKAIIDDLNRRKKEMSDAPDLFADFNGIDDPKARTEFYQHDQHWSNRFILGDSLAVMASLAEREALRGKVQCIYFDPPYGIRFNSNWQVSTLSRDVKDGKQQDVSREPEVVQAFRDTWKDGIHSYLTYLRDRLTVARELLTESGSIFVQIGDENVHRVRAVMDVVFGDENFVSEITVTKTGSLTGNLLSSVTDNILWYSRSIASVKFRKVFDERTNKDAGEFSADPLKSSGSRTGTTFNYYVYGRTFPCSSNEHWKVMRSGLDRLQRADRLIPLDKSLRMRKSFEDFPVQEISNIWTGMGGSPDMVYVVQTTPRMIARCVLMATDPGDLVLDPTCGSGTTADVAEQWGRRWITIDTSRVALALARTRLMSARYPYYLLADSIEGRRKEQEVTGKILPDAPTLQDVRQGFVYQRVPHIMLNHIANNAEIDVIYEKSQAKLEPLRNQLNRALGRNVPWQEWEVPREAGDEWRPEAAAIHGALRDMIAERELGERAVTALARLNAILDRQYSFKTLPERSIDPWTSDEANQAHAQWWEGRIARQKEIDASIAKAADVVLLYDRPYEDKSRVRVAGPFTVESLSPHRVVPADEEELIDLVDTGKGARRRLHKVMPATDFAAMVLENLRSAGVHQSEKRDTIRFASLNPWPGEYVGADGRFMEGDTERRAAILIGPEFGTLSRVDLVAAAREAMDARFDALIACAFAFDAHASEISKLGPLPILKAKMNPDLHMAGDLKNTGKGNLFVVFGEPDIDIEHESDGRMKVRVKGVDVYDPNTGEIRSNDTKGIAAWFIDTAYNEESFFVRHAYFLGANDPYKSLKTALQADIDPEAWETLYRAESRPFARPSTGKIAVKVINHFGDEVMKVFRV
jgi:adenine-specific DNA-methyltransferase